MDYSIPFYETEIVSPKGTRMTVLTNCQGFVLSVQKGNGPVRRLWPEIILGADDFYAGSWSRVGTMAI